MDVPMFNKCPGYNLYISGFIALRRPKALQNCRITHIVSVMDWQFEEDNPMTRGFQHLHIPVDDVEDENLLEWFPRSNVFIQKGLDYCRTPEYANSRPDLSSDHADQGSGVLIHCAMGKSRSSTVLLAYLLWSSRQPKSKANISPTASDEDMISLPPKPLSVIDALTLLRQGRPIAEPNEGFMDQLYLYVDMGCPSTQSKLESHKLYRRWMNKRNVAESLRINQAPEMDDIKFEDEPDEDKPDDPATLKLADLSLPDTTKNHSENAPEVSAPTGQDPSLPSPNSNPNSLSSPTAPSTRSQSQSQPDLQIKCRRCRHLLARSTFIHPHLPLHSDPSTPHAQTPAFNPTTHYRSPQNQSPHESDPSLTLNAPQPPPPSKCAHIFLHPLSWMKPALSPGNLSGKLICPNAKCSVNIGKFAWQGLRCSCGGWVTPGFALARGKVDELAVRGAVGNGNGKKDGNGDGNEGTGGAGAGAGAGAAVGAAGIRLPPGMKRGGNL